MKSENQGVKSEDVKIEGQGGKGLKKMTIERTLKLDKNNKELEITTTIKKADATPKKSNKFGAGQKNRIKMMKKADTAAGKKSAEVAQKKMKMRKKAALAK